MNQKTRFSIVLLSMFLGLFAVLMPVTVVAAPISDAPDVRARAESGDVSDQIVAFLEKFGELSVEAAKRGGAPSICQAISRI